MSARKKPPEKKPPEEQPPSSVGDATERLAAIVEAAERAASKVIDDAEREAQRRIEEAEERADRVVAERLRALADELDAEGAGGRPSKPHLRPVGPADEPGENGEGVRARAAGPSGARLLATQMAVSGASREEIERRLRTGFQIEETSEILDAILGPEE